MVKVRLMFKRVLKKHPLNLIDKVYTMVYIIIVHKVLQMETYKKWFKKLRDEKAKFAIGKGIDYGKID